MNVSVIAACILVIRARCKSQTSCTMILWAMLAVLRNERMPRPVHVIQGGVTTWAIAGLQHALCIEVVQL